MTFLWVVTGAALAVAVAALIAVRRVSARLAQLSDNYWELKYQYLELRKQMDRIPGADPPVTATSPPQAARESFVPLTSLRR